MCGVLKHIAMLSWWKPTIHQNAEAATLFHPPQITDLHSVEGGGAYIHHNQVREMKTKIMEMNSMLPEKTKCEAQPPQHHSKVCSWGNSVMRFCGMMMIFVNQSSLNLLIIYVFLGP